MLSKGMPLRYQISSWRQLPKCLSNNSRDLSIHVSDLFNNDDIRGFRITVEHPIFGVVFACIIDGSGRLVSKIDGYPSLTTETILTELERFGFLITYHPNKDINSSQLEYLITLRGLNYDKIRKIRISQTTGDTNEYRVKIVGFKSDVLGDWLNNWYSPTEKDFLKALLDGTAINLTDIGATRRYNWDWLDYVANIDDVIRDAADDGVYVNTEDSYA